MTKLFLTAVIGLFLMSANIQAAETKKELPKMVVVKVDAKGNASIYESSELIKLDESTVTSLAQAEFKPVQVKDIPREENEFNDRLNTTKARASWYPYWGWYGVFASSYCYYGYGYNNYAYYYPYYRPYYYGGYGYYAYSYGYAYATPYYYY